MIVSIEQAKEYLRVDSDDEDTLIEALIKSSQNLCQDVTRLDESDFESAGEVAKIAVFFALSYFYEHREDADTHALTLRLRSLLFGIRKDCF